MSLLLHLLIQHRRACVADSDGTAVVDVAAVDAVVAAGVEVCWSRANEVRTS